MSSVTESTVVIASKHLIKTTLQPFMGLLEETNPFSSGWIGISCGSYITLLEQVSREQKTNT